MQFPTVLTIDMNLEQAVSNIQTNKRNVSIEGGHIEKLLLQL